MSSIEPFVFNLAIPSLVTPAYMVKSPPINIFPSGWVEIAETPLSAPLPPSLANDMSMPPGVPPVPNVKLFEARDLEFVPPVIDPSTDKDADGSVVPIPR